jgi:predicted Zn-dependent protease
LKRPVFGVEQPQLEAISQFVDNSADRFVILNGLADDQSLKPGGKVKVIPR